MCWLAPGGDSNYAAVDRAVQRRGPIRARQLRVLCSRHRPRPARQGRMDLLLPRPATAETPLRPGSICQLVSTDAQ